MSDSAIENIRNDFPILTRKINNNSLVYLDNAATTHMPQVVIDAVTNYHTYSHSNIHSGIHALSEQSTKLYQASRKTVSDFIGSASESNIIFTSGTTHAINMVAHGYVEALMHREAEIIVSAMEHHANLLPWQQLAKKYNAQLRIIPMLENGELDIAAYKSMLSSQTVFVALTHVSNVLGTINPIQSMVEMAKQWTIPVLVDGAQAVGHTKVDVSCLGCDFYAFSGHKTYGPTGIGVLYMRSEHMPKMQPHHYGGGMIVEVAYDSSRFVQNGPERFEAGTPNISGAIGLAKALDYLTHLGLDNLLSHEQSLLSYATQKLSAIRGLTIHGKAKDKVGVIAFTLKDIHAHDITSLLDEAGVAVRGGHHCAMPLVRSMGLPSVGRVSLGIYNQKADIDRLYDALLEVLEVFAL